MIFTRFWLNKYSSSSCLLRRAFLSTTTTKYPEIEEASDHVKKIASSPVEPSLEKGVSTGDEAKFVFHKVWDSIEKERGIEKLRFPSEIIWLMGAPGSGKGTNAPAIAKARGITNPPIVMSHLLKDPEVKNLMDQGQMVGDQLVLDLLFRALTGCDTSSGVIVDGFPRTEIQVEILKLFYDKLLQLRSQFLKTPLREVFRKPIFRLVVLYIDENESLKRQLKRGLMVKDHNQRVRATGEGELLKERATDFDEKLIKARYKIFQQHYGALTRLKKLFPFHLVHSDGPIEDVVRNVFKEFEYQSSLELDQETFDTIEHIPIADQVGRHARQDLIRRLEHYQVNQKTDLDLSVGLIDRYFVPVIKRNSISGAATVRLSLDELMNENLIDIVLDVLSERGFIISADCRRTTIPVKVNPDTWDIISKTEIFYVFNIKFPRNQIRGFSTMDSSDSALRNLAHEISSTEK